MEATMMTTIPPEVQRRLARQAGVDPDSATDTQAATAIALSLMQGDPATFKVGYSAPNALLSAMEIFPHADRAEVSRQLGIGCPVCVREDLGCRALSGLPECRSREVVVIEDRVGNFEYGPLVEGAKVLTADHIELTVEALIAHAVKEYSEHEIIVVVADKEHDWMPDGWCSAREWLEHRLGEEGVAAALEALDR
jgi:hypothetical protein